ncbi:unnamed protein product, partial [Rotaria magnacalcarata]
FQETINRLDHRDISKMMRDMVFIRYLLALLLLLVSAYGQGSNTADTAATSISTLPTTPTGTDTDGPTASPPVIVTGTDTDGSTASPPVIVTGTDTDGPTASPLVIVTGTNTDSSPHSSTTSGTAGTASVTSATTPFSHTTATSPVGSSATTPYDGTTGTGTGTFSTSTVSRITTTSSPIPVGSIFTVEYLISQGVNLSQYNLSTQADIKEFCNRLRRDLEGCLFNITCDLETCYRDGNSIIYGGIAESNGTLTEQHIVDCINNSTSSYAKNPMVLGSRKLNCSGGQLLRSEGKCRYCSNQPPCANFPESKCVRDLSTLNDHCECDRTKYFFRTNYEYDGKCSRFATVWWPQMLALCLLVFAILILLCACLMCLRRRRVICKRSVGKTEVMGNSPNKDRDFEYIELNNMDQSAADYTVRSTNNHLTSSVYPTGISNDYPYQRRTPQSPRHLPLIQTGRNSTVYNEIDDRGSVIHDMVF